MGADDGDGMWPMLLVLEVLIMMVVVVVVSVAWPREQWAS